MYKYYMITYVNNYIYVIYNYIYVNVIICPSYGTYTNLHYSRFLKKLELLYLCFKSSY